MSKYKKKACEIHKYHSPRPQRIDVHHIWPVGEDGPDVPSNVLGVCQTGHTNIHQLLESYLDASVTWEVLRSYGPIERKYARLGYERICNQKL